MKRVWLILVAFLGLALQAAPASAAIQYTLNCTTVACTGAGSGNYGTVTLTDIGSGSIHVDVSLESGYRFGANNTDALLWNGLTNDILSVSNLTSGFGPTGSNANGSYAASPFTTASTTFDYRLQRSNSSGAPTALSFDVTKTGGLTLANFATGNDGGVYYFASQIRTIDNTTLFYVASNQAGVQVPEPGTLTLSIAGLAGLAGLVLLRRRRYGALPG
jgi:MYXO-CTERM domain-containing protein